MTLDRIFTMTSSAEAKAVYDDWAESYDRDMLSEEQDYVAPEIAAKRVAKHLGSEKIGDAKILDAGCGTGLVGANLTKLGAKHIDGIDLSPGMLQVAGRSGAYRSLNTADLSKPLPQASHSYDVIICVGTMTQGHVGPEPFDEFSRIVKPGGFIICTIRDNVWQKNGYEDKVNALQNAGKVKLVSSELEPYRRGQETEAVLVVLQGQ